MDITNDNKMQIEQALMQKKEELKKYGVGENLNINKLLAHYTSMEKPIVEILETIDKDYKKLTDSLSYAQNFSTDYDEFSLIEGTDDKSLSGIIGGFHLSKNTLHLHSQFRNTEEGREKLKTVRSQNWPANKGELTQEEQKEVVREAKQLYEIPAMKDSIALLLPYLEKMPHIKNISIESNCAFIKYIRPAFEEFGFTEGVKTQEEIEEIEKVSPGDTKEDGNRYKTLTIPRKLLITNIKKYQAARERETENLTNKNDSQEILLI